MKLVIFDIDGTLTQTNEVDSRCFIEALQHVLGVEEFDTCWENYNSSPIAGSRKRFPNDIGIAR